MCGWNVVHPAVAANVSNNDRQAAARFICFLSRPVFGAVVDVRAAPRHAEHIVAIFITRKAG
jgi:hypothetical protein